jgi:BlaI family penicillinase repressor
MGNTPSISAAEWTIMQVLWREAPLSAVEVVEALEGQSEWHPKTIRTLLGRLVAKGALRREKRGGALRFSPLVTEEQCVRDESRTFLERCFAGMAQPMLAHFIEHENLSPQDIAALRAMLDRKTAREGDDDGR